MKIINSKDFDFFNNTMRGAAYKAKKMPEPLPWIEPSINMLHLEVVSSYMFGSYIASIITQGALLEHVLRMAVIDPINSGVSRNISNSKRRKYSSIGKMINDPELEPTLINLMGGQEENFIWWKEIAYALRNKSVHLAINELLKKFGNSDYMGEYSISDIDTDPPGQWGFLWHRYGELVSTKFIHEGTTQIKIIIKNTRWQPDEHWWISQKYQYEGFFKFKWKLSDMQQSIAKVV
jgi:hypothetical protein